jgi:hypothetical protein
MAHTKMFTSPVILIPQVETGTSPRTRHLAWHGMAWHGMAWHGMAWHGMAWHGMAWHGSGPKFAAYGIKSN